MKKTLLIILMILAISVIFILPQLPVQKLFDDSSESLIEADNSNEISQSRIAEKTKYRKDAQLVNQSSEIDPRCYIFQLGDGFL